MKAFVSIVTLSIIVSVSGCAGLSAGFGGASKAMSSPNQPMNCYRVYDHYTCTVNGREKTCYPVANRLDCY